MNALTLILIILLIVVPILLCFVRGAKEAAAVTLSISIALFFANLDKFSRFKGGGIEAELRTAVTEAYAAIDQLKELGLSLTSPIVDELAVSGRMLQWDNWGRPLDYWFTNNFIYDIQIICHAKPA